MEISRAKQIRQKPGSYLNVVIFNLQMRIAIEKNNADLGLLLLPLYNDIFYKIYSSRECQYKFLKSYVKLGPKAKRTQDMPLVTHWVII